MALVPSHICTFWSIQRDEKLQISAYEATSLCLHNRELQNWTMLPQKQRRARRFGTFKRSRWKHEPIKLTCLASDGCIMNTWTCSTKVVIVDNSWNSILHVRCSTHGCDDSTLPTYNVLYFGFCLTWTHKMSDSVTMPNKLRQKLAAEREESVKPLQ